MAGEEVYMRLRVVMDGIQEVIDRAQVALNELAEIVNPVELEEGPAEFPLPGGEFDDGPPPPTWQVDETSVSVQAHPEPLGPLVKTCEEPKAHASHLWFEGDNIAPWDCPGIGPELEHLLCDDSRMHDGHVWTTGAGERVWCAGFPF